MQFAANMFMLVLSSAGMTFAFFVLLSVLRHGRGSNDYPPMSNRTSLALFSLAAGLVLLELTVFFLLATLMDMGFISPTFGSSDHIWLGVILGVSVAIALGLVLAGIVLDPHTFRRRRRF